MADLNAYFKSIIDQDREAVVICDLDHTILYMNPAAVVDYKKYGGAALLGKSLLACHNPNSVEAIRKVVEWFAPQHRLYLSQRKARPRCLHGCPAGRGRYPDRLLREA